MAANDTITQAEELMKSWTKTQQAMWESWRAAMPDLASQPTPEAWEKAVATWKDMMQRSLSAQADFVQFWSESVKSIPMAPSQMSDMATMIADTTKRWTDTQSQIYSSWLEAVGKGSPSAMMQSMDDGARKAFDAWRETVHSSIEMQRRLIESMMGAKKD